MLGLDVLNRYDEPLVEWAGCLVMELGCEEVVAGRSPPLCLVDRESPDLLEIVATVLIVRRRRLDLEHTPGSLVLEAEAEDGTDACGVDNALPGILERPSTVGGERLVAEGIRLNRADRGVVGCVVGSAVDAIAAEGAG